MTVFDTANFDTLIGLITDIKCDLELGHVSEKCQQIITTSCRRAAVTICLRPWKLTISPYLFARSHLSGILAT